MGENPSDMGYITVEDNQLIKPAGVDFLKELTSPVPLPLLLVLQGLEAVTGLAVLSKAIELGYPETENWIKFNLEKYMVGLDRGFVQENPH